MIPLGETVNVTFWSFFPLALAWKEAKKEKERAEATKRKDGVRVRQRDKTETI